MIRVTTPCIDKCDKQLDAMLDSFGMFPANIHSSQNPRYQPLQIAETPPTDEKRQTYAVLRYFCLTFLSTVVIRVFVPNNVKNRFVASLLLLLNFTNIFTVKISVSFTLFF